MGSLISSTLAEIFSPHIEHTHILNKIKINMYIKSYMDTDMLMTLLLYNGNNIQIKQLHQYIKKLHPKLNFTLEIEVNKMVNFLDLTITKTDNKSTFNICRKPTITITLIYNTSNHPTQHKHAMFHSMIKWLFNIHLNHADYNTKANTNTLLKKMAMNLNSLNLQQKVQTEEIPNH